MKGNTLFSDTATFMNFLWSAPLQIALSLYFLYNELDWAAFTILGVFIVLAPLSGVITGKLRNKIGVMMKKKDKRIKGPRAQHSMSSLFKHLNVLTVWVITQHSISQVTSLWL